MGVFHFRKTAPPHHHPTKISKIFQGLGDYMTRNGMVSKQRGGGRELPALPDSDMVSLLNTETRRNMRRDVGVPFLVP